MDAKSMMHRLAVVLFVFFWMVLPIPSPALAQDDAEPPPPTISFVQEGELIFGPPLPSTVDFVINIKDIGNTNSDLKIQLINLTDEKGKDVSDSFQVIPCELEETKVHTNIKDQVLTRRICLVTASLEWGTYTALLQATLGDLAQATKSIKLVVGPEIPVSILSSEITVLGRACPQFVRTDLLKRVLCPKFGIYNLYTTEGTDLISFTGYSEKDSIQFKKLFESASGTLVSLDGAGTIFARLEPWDSKNNEDFTTCFPQIDRMTCSKTRLRFRGTSFRSGTYSGTFYLNTEDQSNDATKVIITFKVKDLPLLPFLIILLGLLVSAWITWTLGPRKSNKEQQETKALIVRKRNELGNRMKQFRKEIVNMEKGLAYFVEDPDSISEVEFLLNSSQNVSDDKQSVDLLTNLAGQNLAQRMIEVVPLFVRLRFFYLALYKLHAWEHRLPNKTPGKNDLEKKIEDARQKLWTADSTAKMDEAQDGLIQAFIFAHDIYWVNRNKHMQDPPKFQVEKQPVTIEETEKKSFWKQAWDWLVDFMKALPGFLISLRNIPNLLRWVIVLLSGYYVVYATNPTFGTPQDYIYAFLWGSATNAGIEFITKFLGANTSIMSVISGVTK